MGLPGRNGTDGQKVSLHTTKSNVQIYGHYIDTTQPSLETLQGKIGRIGAPGCKGDPGDKVSLFTCCIVCVRKYVLSQIITRVQFYSIHEADWMK